MVGSVVKLSCFVAGGKRLRKIDPVDAGSSKVTLKLCKESFLIPFYSSEREFFAVYVDGRRNDHSI